MFDDRDRSIFQIGNRCDLGRAHWSSAFAVDADVLATLGAAAFGERREMLRSSLKSLVADPDALRARADLESTQRADEIDIAGFAAVANAV